MEKAAEDDEQENGFVRGDLDNKEIHLMKYWKYQKYHSPNKEMRLYDLKW